MVIKKILRTIGKVVIVMLALSVIITGLLRNVHVQTYLARVAAIHLSEYLDTRVKIEKLRVSAYFTMSAEGVEINDLQNKPLVYFKSLYLSADLFDAIKSDLVLNKVEIDSASVYLRKYEGSAKFNIIDIVNKFKPTDKVATDTLEQAQPDFAFKVDQFVLKNSRFIYQIEEKSKALAFGVDYFDMDIQDIDLSLKNVSLVNDSIKGRLEHLSVKEKSGFQLNHFEGDLTVFSRGMELKYAMLETPQSNLEFNLDFGYPSWRSYTRFVDEVKLTGELFSGEVNTSDIAFFAPAMQGMDNPFELRGTFSGPIRNLRARNLVLTTGSETKFRGNVQMTGLPKIYETFVSLRIREFSTSANDIQRFKLKGGRVLKKLPKTITSLGLVNIKGNFTGFYNDFVSNANFRTSIGQLTTDIQFSNNPNRDIIEYRGDFKASQFDLGRFLKREEYFGNLNFDLQIKGEGLDLETLNANVEGEISKFQFKGRRLEDVAINGLFQERQFTGDFSINDELIKADFQGHINFDTLVPVFDFNLKLAETRLALLGLLPIDSSAVLTSDIRLNFSGNTLDNIRGDIQLDSTLFRYKNEQYLMREFEMQLTSGNGNQRTIDLRSDFVDGEVDGEFQLSKLGNTLNLFLSNYLPNVFSETEFIAKQSTIMNWDIRFKNFSHILPLIQPKIQISEDGRWIGNFDAEENSLNSLLSLQNAMYQDVKFNNLQLEIYNNEQSLQADLAMTSMIFKEETENDTLQLGIDNLRFSSLVHSDSIYFDLGWNNDFKPIQNTAEIKGFVDLSEKDFFDIKFNKADLIINDTTWIIHPENRFLIGEKQLRFENVGFHSGTQLLGVTGAIDKNNEQALKIDFNNFDLSNFDILLNSKGIDLDGLIDGDIQFINIVKNIDFLADLRINDLKVNKEIIGDATINSKRNLDKSIFLNAEIVKRLEDDRIVKPLIFEGYYFPDKYDNSLDFSLYLSELPIQVVSPFLYKWVDRFDGSISGNAFVGGNLRQPDVSGKLHLDEVKFRIIYLNTAYSLTADALIDNTFIDLQEVDFRDRENNRAAIYGGLFHNHLKDFGVDVSIWPQEFMGLNTTKGMNSLYYGKAFVNGTVDINGLFKEAVELDIKLEAAEGSKVVIPISLTADISDNEFITFINHADTLEKKQERKEIKELSNFSLNMDLSLNPNASVEIILPEQLGNIEGEGFGDLNMNLNRAGNFTMAGDYQVNKGTFLFTVKNIYRKRFDLLEGGTISWTGDPYAGELNMKAVYHVKTSLNSLGTVQNSDTTEVSARVPVDCIIGLKDEILNPSVKFGFEFPNSSEEIRQQVFSLIDTTNEAEMSQQMLSLLVLNSFSFASATGNEDFASNVSGSSLQLVANQLSNWLSQISNDLDVGIHYRPGGDITNEEVEVALSTQLFDERVTIDGNFGYQNTDDVPESNASNIVGDINVEVKITKDGRFRMKAFNRTNTVDMIENTAPFTQGVGVFYRKEFNFFRDLFKRKKKKEEPKTDEDVVEPQNKDAKEEEDLELEPPLPSSLISEK